MGAAAEMLGLTFIYACLYTILLNLIGLAIGRFTRPNRIPLGLGIGSIIVLCLTTIMLILNCPCDVFLFMIPSITLTVLNLRYWRIKARDYVPHPNSTTDSWFILGGMGATLAIMVGTLFLSCGAMYPLMNGLMRIEHGRGPANINRDDIKEGMTADEIETMYGKPHQKSSRDGKQDWIYYNGGIGGEIIAIYFGTTNRVERVSRLD